MNHKIEYKIIENTREARDGFGHGYGSNTTVITTQDLHELMQGKCLAVNINGGEYAEFIALSCPENAW